MRKTINLFILLSLGLALISCDGYKYKGMTGNEAQEHASHMDLPTAYKFYIETYKGTHPPMLDVAQTFDRFGKAGKAYILKNAAMTNDSEEFEADMTALLILKNRCSAKLRSMLIARASATNVDASYVAQACDSK